MLSTYLIKNLGIGNLRMFTAIWLIFSLQGVPQPMSLEQCALLTKEEERVACRRERAAAEYRARNTDISIEECRLLEGRDEKIGCLTARRDRNNAQRAQAEAMFRARNTDISIEECLRRTARRPFTAICQTSDRANRFRF
jgi:hypothetical protein